jgi:hypothetical protein
LRENDELAPHFARKKEKFSGSLVARALLGNISWNYGIIPIEGMISI